jgi:hypothetical protein
VHIREVLTKMPAVKEVLFVQYYDSGLDSSRPVCPQILAERDCDGEGEHIMPLFNGNLLRTATDLSLRDRPVNESMLSSSIYRKLERNSGITASMLPVMKIVDFDKNCLSHQREVSKTRRIQGCFHCGRSFSCIISLVRNLPKRFLGYGYC